METTTLPKVPLDFKGAIAMLDSLDQRILGSRPDVHFSLLRRMLVKKLEVCFAPARPAGGAGGTQQSPPPAASGAAGAAQEVRNFLFCPSQEKFHTVVLKGVRNISDALENRPMKVLL